MNRNAYRLTSVSVAETDGWTHAVARLQMADGKQFLGRGEARLNPADQDSWTTGTQMAAARAMSDQAGQLLHAAATGMEEISREPAHLHL
jgi:Domain of unknown function (DUF1876)